MATPQWYDDLLEGEFAGVAVRFPSMRKRIGRYNATTEVPGGDRIHARDLGKRVAAWRLEFLIIGDTYHVDAQELEDKLESNPGPWTLIDPWRGEAEVEITSEIETDRNTDDGGMARFRMDVKLADPLQFPVIFEAIAAVKTAAPPAKLTARDEFVSKFSLGKLKRLIKSALGVVTTGMRVVNGKVSSVLSIFGDVSGEIDLWEQQVDQLNQSPQQLWNGMQDVFNSLRDLVREIASGPDFPEGLNDGGGRELGDPVSVLEEVFRDIDGLDLGADDFQDDLAQSKNGKEAVDSIKAAEALIKIAATASMVEALADTEPDNAEQAAALVSQMTTHFDNLLAADIDAPTMESLLDLKAATIDVLVSQGQKTAQVTTVFAQVPTPALVLAKRIYGDSRRDAELIRRNRAHVPLQMSGEIEAVLDDG